MKKVQKLAPRNRTGFQLSSALNKASVVLQEAAGNEKEVARVFAEEITKIGLFGGYCLLDDTGNTLVFKSVFLNNKNRKLLSGIEKLVNISAEGFYFDIEGVDVFEQISSMREPVFSPDNADFLIQIIPGTIRKFAKQIIKDFGGKPAVFAPMIINGNVIGMMIIIGSQLTLDDAPAVQAFSDQLAIAIENARLIDGLRTSEDRYRDLIENSHDMIYTHDLEGNFLSVNPRSHKMLGYKQEELLMLKFQDILDKDASHQFDSYITTLMDEGIASGNLYIKTREGEERIWEYNTSLRSAEIDKPIVRGMARDITEQVRFEEDLRDSETRYRSIFNGVRDAIFVESPTGEILDVNQAACDMFGYTRQEFLTKSVGDLVPPGELTLGINGAAVTPPEHPVETVNLRANGEQFPVEISGREQSIGGNNVMLVVVRDISKRKQADEERQRQLKELTILHQVASIASNSDSESEIIDRFVNIIGETFYPDNFGILMIDSNSGDLIVSPSYHGISEETKQFVSNLGHNSVTSHVAKTGNPYLISDTSTDDLYFPASPGMQSELCVPIKTGKVIIGVINAESSQLDAFSKSDERFLSTLAGQIGTSIGRLRNENSEREQRIFAEALQDITLSFNQSLKSEEILDQILENVNRVMSPEGANIMLLEGGRVTIARESGNIKEKREIGVDGWSKAINEFPTLERMVKTKQPILISDTKSSPLWKNENGVEWIQSYVSAPIFINGGKIKGFINLNHSKANFFTEKHIDQISAFVSHVAVALENARMFKETQKRSQEAMALYQTALDTHGEYDLDIVLEKIIYRTKELLNVDLAGIYLNKPKINQLEVAAATDPFIPIGTRLEFGEGMAGQVAQTLEPMIEDNYQSWAGRSPQYENIPFTSVMQVPMLYGSELVGVLFVGDKEPNIHKFVDSDIQLLALLAASAAGVVNSAELWADANRRLKRLDSLRKIDQAISGSSDLRMTIDFLLDHVLQQLDVDAAAVLKYQPKAHSLEYISGKGLNIKTAPFTISNNREGLAGTAVVERRIIQISDVGDLEDDSKVPYFCRDGRYKTYIAIPLVSKGMVLGVLEIYNKLALDPAQEWVEYLNTLAGQAALAIDNISLFNDLQMSNNELVFAYDATIEGWAHALELRDMETEGHSRRVVDLTNDLAIEFGIKDEDLLHIRRGALLHDIGKMGVPDAILHKPDQLDEDEWEIMRKHPIHARDWLSSIRYLQPALDIPFSHHEKWDGTGYPRGLEGQDIPLAARIFAIVDVWDALSVDRPYRKAWSKKKILDHIREQSGKHFDPQVVDVFLRYIGAD